MSDVQYAGQQSLTDGVGDFNRQSFLVEQVLGRTRTATLARVEMVTGGGLSEPPVVSVTSVINQLDGAGNSVPHGIIYGVPALRLQGGAAGIVCDPRVGDVGLLVISDRDLSTVKANTGKVSNPGSRRRFDLSDSVYVGLAYGAALTSSITLDAETGEITLTSHGAIIKISADGSLSLVRGGSSVVLDVAGNVTITAPLAIALVSATLTWNGVPITVP